MKKDTKDMLSIMIMGIIIIGFVVVSICQYNSSRKYITIEDEVVDVDLSHERYMTVTFDNGESYNVEYEYYNSEVDFTVNSKMKIKLRTSSFWLHPNTDNIWSIVQIVKIPD